MWRKFLKDKRGGIAPMVAIAAVPLIGMVGAAVDYSRANAARASLQAAIDSTALTVSRSAATVAAAELQSIVSSTFNSIYQRPEASNVSVTSSYTSNGGSKVKITGTATVKTTFASALGIDQITISASSTSTWGNTRLRVALVLDNTGSMSSAGKMTALKTASLSLLAQLQLAALIDGDVYVSIVPFNKNVNLGASNYSQSWVRWDLWDAANGRCSSLLYKSQSSCTSRGYVWTPANHNTWNGCVTDRDQNYDTTNAAPTTGATLYPAEQYSSCPAETMGLSSDWVALAAKISAMQPAGNTNQGIGLQVGWQTLTAAPFNVPAKDPNYDYKDVIILLSDGMNTENRWYSSQSPIDTRQLKTCTNAKAAGITIYTVQVNTGNDPTSAVLKSCASDAGKFFLLTSATELVTTFSQIGTALSDLRLAM